MVKVIQPPDLLKSVWKLCYPSRDRDEVSLVSLNMATSGFCSLISLLRYRCFFSELMPLTFHMSNDRSSLVTLRLPLF